MSSNSATYFDFVLSEKKLYVSPGRVVACCLIRISFGPFHGPWGCHRTTTNPLARTNIENIRYRGLPTGTGLGAELVLKIYHVCATFIKYVVIEAQTSALIVKSAISLHSFRT